MQNLLAAITVAPHNYSSLLSPWKLEDGFYFTPTLFQCGLYLKKASIQGLLSRKRSNSDRMTDYSIKVSINMF